MTDNEFVMAFSDLLNPVKRRAEMQRQRTMAMFRDQEHARQVWDDWDGLSGEMPNGEDAHLYLNLIGDGEYCAV